MIGVIVHMEAASNPLRHTWTGPQLGFKTGGLRTAQQIFFQSASIPCAQSLWTSGSRASGQSATAPAAHRCFPTPHTTPVHTHPAGHFDRTQALPKKGQTAKPSPFQFLGTPERSHRFLQEFNIGHYL